MAENKEVTVTRARDVLDTRTLRRVAAFSGADPRTVDRVLLGMPVSVDIAIRVRAVLAEIGVTPLSPSDAPKPGGQP